MSSEKTVDFVSDSGQEYSYLCASLTWPVSDEKNRAKKGILVALGTETEDKVGSHCRYLRSATRFNVPELRRLKLSPVLPASTQCSSSVDVLRKRAAPDEEDEMTTKGAENSPEVSFALGIKAIDLIVAKEKGDKRCLQSEKIPKCWTCKTRYSQILERLRLRQRTLKSSESLLANTCPYFGIPHKALAVQHASSQTAGDVFRCTPKYALEWKEKNGKPDATKVEVVTVADFLDRLGRKVGRINLLEIEAYLKLSKIARKILSYSDKEADQQPGNIVQVGSISPLSFCSVRRSHTADGRLTFSLVRTSSGQEEVDMKYLLFNLVSHFLQVVECARSVILAAQGRTMSPLPAEKITSFFCAGTLFRNPILSRELREQMKYVKQLEEKQGTK
ncbi:hypothetical protein B0H19DRAFT_1079474 [Mycena capillaripes]|nr:hypothetical protein B0H19DRAFT_1079474 [Mycena capillaripes]